MGTKTITMSLTELDRFALITRLQKRRLTQLEAARTLSLGVRQVQRLCAVVRRDGADGLTSRKRGRPSSRRFPKSFTRKIITLILATGRRLRAHPGHREAPEAGVSSAVASCWPLSE